MFRLRITYRLCATLFLLLPTFARAADPSVVVTPGSGGTVNVLAQYAPVEEVLAAIARAEGSRAEFPEHLRSLVTLSDDSAFKTPEQWISNITTGLNLTSPCDGATRRFSRMFPDRYDPTLTASEILARYRSNKDPATPTGGVQGRILLLYGQYIAPPYGVTITEESEAYRVDVNGIEVRSVPKAKKVEDPPLPADMSGVQLRSIEELYRYTYRVLYPSLRKSMDVESALEETARFLRSQEVVVDVAVTDEHPRIWMTLAGREHRPLAKSAFPENYDLDTATVTGEQGVPPQERAELEAENLRKMLSRPGLIVHGTNGKMIMPGLSHLQELAEIMQQANELGVLELECELMSMVTNRQVAREVAANVGQNPAPLLSALDYHIEQMQTELFNKKAARQRRDTLAQDGMDPPSPAE